MTHDAGEGTHGAGTIGSRPSQADFIGKLALVLMALALIVSAVVLIAAATAG
jgi:hypothetical protein